ncbi:TPA: hypothetical protein ACH3X2_003994 [Trebouxia sp. C0005]
MSDAGEVMMALYEQLAPVASKANQPGLLNYIFGLHVKAGVGSDPSAALPGVSPTQGLYNAAGLAD